MRYSWILELSWYKMELRTANNGKTFHNLENFFTWNLNLILWWYMYKYNHDNYAKHFDVFRENFVLINKQTVHQTDIELSNNEIYKVILLIQEYCKSRFIRPSKSFIDVITILFVKMVSLYLKLYRMYFSFCGTYIELYHSILDTVKVLIIVVY